MYDFHAHILPGMDHGSPDAETSKQQMEVLSALGVTHVVATSHFSPHGDNVSDFLQRRSRSADELRCHLSEHWPTVHLGAEVLISDGIDRMEGIDRLCLVGTNVLLLEMPFFEWNEGLKRTVKRLCRSDMKILLAHVDRYPRDAVEELYDYGAFGQVNCEAFSALFPKNYYKSWFLEGSCLALGTDIHLPDRFRKKCVADAHKKLGEKALDALTQTSRELLDGAVPLA